MRIPAMNSLMSKEPKTIIKIKGPMRNSTVGLIGVILGSLGTAGVANLTQASTWEEVVSPWLVAVWISALATGLLGWNSRSRQDEDREIMQLNGTGTGDGKPDPKPPEPSKP
jgi:hypothetical protein